MLFCVVYPPVYEARPPSSSCFKLTVNRLPGNHFKSEVFHAPRTDEVQGGFVASTPGVHFFTLHFSPTLPLCPGIYDRDILILLCAWSLLVLKSIEIIIALVLFKDLYLYVMDFGAQFSMGLQRFSDRIANGCVRRYIESLLVLCG